MYTQSSRGANLALAESEAEAVVSNKACNVRSIRTVCLYRCFVFTTSHTSGDVHLVVASYEKLSKYLEIISVYKLIIN